MKRNNSGNILEVLLSEAAGSDKSERDNQGIVVGTVTSLDDQGHVRVMISGCAAGAVLARSIVALNQSHVGQQVVIAFERGDTGRPIVVGAFWRPGDATVEAKAPLSAPCVEADVDGETLVLSARREIVLRCGKSSITLTRAGKVLIRGDYLLSRSSGVNRIKGGSVQIN